MSRQFAFNKTLSGGGSTRRPSQLPARGSKRGGGPDAGKIVSTALWLILAGFIARGLFVNSEGEAAATHLYAVVNYLQYLPHLVLIVFGFMSAAVASRRLSAADALAINAFTVLTILEVANGAIWGSRFEISECWRQLVPMLSVAFVYIPIAHPGAVASFSRTVLMQIPIIAVFCIYVMVKHPMDVLRLNYTGVHAYALDGVLSVGFCVPFLLLGDFKRAIMAGAAYAACVYYAIHEQSRATVAGLVPLNAIAMLGLLTINKARSFKRLAIGGATIVVLLGVLQVGSALSGTSSLQDFTAESIRGFLFRFTNADRSVTSGDLVETYNQQKEIRGGELYSVLSQSTVKTFLIGEGYGAFWDSEYWGVPWSMVHNGQVHLVMKGGVVYSLLFHFIVIGSIVGAMSRRNLKDSYMVSSLIVVIDRLLFFSIHSVFYTGISVAVFWLSLGVLFTAKHRGPANLNR